MPALAIEWPILLGAAICTWIGGLGVYLWLRPRLERARRRASDADAFERRLKLLDDVTLEAVFVHEDGVVVDVNGGFVRTFGRTREEWIGQHVDAITPPEVLEVVQAQQKSEDPYELVVTRPDGTLLPIRVVPRTVRIGDQTVRAAVLQDLTERRRGEQVAASAQVEFREMIERIPVGVAIHHRGVIEYANPAIIQALGYSSLDDVRGRLVTDFVLPDDRPLVAERMRTLVEGQPAPPAAEIRFVHKQGQLLQMETLPVRMIEYDGRDCNLVVVHDISERRRMEERLQLADRLVSVGTLAAGVAHEVNNPLAYVIGNLELAGESLRLGANQGETLERVLAEALEGANRVSAIVKDLKMFSRASDEACIAIDVHEVLETAIRIGWNEIRHRAQLVRRYGDVPLVVANPSRLAQVFLNLLVNSAQAIAVGAAEANAIAIATGRDEQGRVTVSIEDTGAGMTVDVQRRIFDPFFTTKAMGEGTGLGLSIVHGIVASLGGEITVASRIGEGTRFCVHLPVAASPQTDTPEPAPIAGDPSRRARILVIDDETAILEMIGQALRIHDVTVTPSGREGLDRARQGGWDLILCDLMMPDVTGVQIHQELSRTHPEVAERMVFLTGGAFTSQAREFLATVPNARLEKPFGLAAVRRVATDQLRRPAPGAPPASPPAD